MKNQTGLTFGLLLALLGLCLPAWGQNITSVNPNTTTAGQNITLVITGSNTNFTAATGFQLRHGTQGTTYQSTNYAISSNTQATADFTIPPNATLGSYGMINYNGQIFNNALTVGVGPGSNYGLVSGKLILDNNSNCTEDLGDVAVAGGIITLSPGPLYITTGPQGDYSGWVPLGTYSLSANVLGCGNWVCPTGGTLSASLPAPLSTDTGKDFYYNPISPCADLGTSVTCLGMRPGFDVNTYVLFTNAGPDLLSGAVGTYVMDSNLTYLSSSVPPTQINGDTLRWNLAPMPSGFSQLITVIVNVPVTLPIGTMLQFRSSLPAVGLDPIPANNNFVVNMPVTGSFDPNDKQVWDPQGNVANGPIDPSTATLHYLVRFQNTGNDTAFTIFVRDTLDTHLDASTLKITGASHPYQFALSGANFAQFTFPNILLVDSFRNEPASHGFISYSIDLNAGVPLGTTISNSASIYFDFNAPVLTNTTNSTLCALLNQDFSFTNAGLAYSFTDLSGSSANAWLWDFGDGGSSTLQNPTHTYSAAGNYTVCLEVSNACRTENVCKNTVLVGVNDALAPLTYKLFPNPSKGVFHLQAALPTRGAVKLQVIDCKGTTVEARDRMSPAGAFQEMIDLSAQPAGIYLLRLEHQGRVYAIKLQKL
jgi:PKD domain/Secretion system C-terminal sorting domain